jgi:hypothetical protein
MGDVLKNSLSNDEFREFRLDENRTSLRGIKYFIAQLYTIMFRIG